MHVNTFTLMVFLASSISGNYAVFGRKFPQIFSIKPGRTPGVKPPGDISYFSETCRTNPEKRKNHVILLDSRNSFRHSRKTLSVKPAKKVRPDAWKKPHISEFDLEQIEKLLQKSNSYCPFMTKSCVIPGKNYSRIVKVKRGVRKIQNFVVTEFEWQKLPQIAEGDWGTCALVGLADTMLTKKQGELIDSHDLVIRVGELPLWAYAQYVGSKTDVTWIRRSGKMAPRGTKSKERPNVRWYIGHNNGITHMPVLKTFGFSLDTFRSEKSIGQEFYDILGKKSRHPSTGFEYALSLIYSRFCTRLDLFGFSSNGGGAYHNTKHLMQISHNCEFESWIFHYIMKNHEDLGVCVYI